MACGPSGNPMTAKKKPNILFILTDNQAASLIGTYGNPDIKTPNIDQLATDGIKFTNAYAVNGMCSPTRATLMTGLMPSQHGLHNWLDDEEMKGWPDDWSAIAEFRTLPYTLKENGYQTALIGKWHLGQPWKPSIGYDDWVTFDVGHTTDFWNNTIIDNDKIYRVEERHVVDFFTEKAVDYIDNYDGEKPFYMQLNYDGPYLNPPTNMGPAKNRFYKDYVGKELKSFPRTALHKNLGEQLKNYAAEGREDAFLSKVIQAIFAMHDDPETRANVASQNTLVDDGIGAVMAALKRNGLDENTVVIFSSDQGNFYGQHGLWTHTTVTNPSNLYEAALHIPLIFRHKGRIKPARVSTRLTGQYDMATTILNYVGITGVDFKNSPGQSFSELLQGKKDEAIDAVFYEQEETRGIRTKKYAYWARINGIGLPMLFDMKKDPFQLVNLADDPEYQNVMEELDHRLKKYFTEYSAPEYDLWNGGVAKGSVIRPEMFQKLYGANWATEAKTKPVFSKTQ